MSVFTPGCAWGKEYDFKRAQSFHDFVPNTFISLYTSPFFFSNSLLGKAAARYRERHNPKKASSLNFPQCLSTSVLPKTTATSHKCYLGLFIYFLNFLFYIGVPWRRKGQPTPVFLPGRSHGQRSLAGYSLWGHKESDMTPQLNNNDSRLATIVSAEQQRDSAIRIQISILPCKLPSHPGCHIMLSRVLCAVHYVLVGYPF